MVRFLFEFANEQKITELAMNAMYSNARQG